MNLQFRIVKYLANLNFAILLLLVIALVSILGVIIEQDQPFTFYETNYNQTLL